MTNKTDKSGRAGRAVTAALILFALLLGTCAKQPTTDERLVMLAPLSPTPTPAATQAQTITGKVVGVSTGDTITVLDASNQQYKIRLDAIDAPESNQDFGSRAKQSLSDLVFGKTVTVTSLKLDRYRRVLGKVTLDVGKLPLEGRNVNLEQVRRGYAWFYHHYAKELRPEDAAAYERAENDAKASKRGMWANGEPMPPWDYRRSGHAAKAPFWETPTAATGPIIGNRNSKIYNLPNCPDYNKVSENNRVPFKTEAEAQAAGYRKAKNCR